MFHHNKNSTMDDDFKECLNCKKEVTSRNFAIHSAFCQRKIQLCCLCSEPVKRDDMKEHLLDSHATTTCNQCDISVEKWELEKHKLTCSKRLVTCKYCEIEIPWDALDEHIEPCGARTEQCSRCKQYVMLRNMEKHPEVCLQVSNLDGSLKLFTDGKRNGTFTKGTSKAHATSAFSTSVSSKRIQAASAPLGECPICHIFIPWIELNIHVPTCASSYKCPSCGEYVLPDKLEVHISRECLAMHQYRSDSKYSLDQKPFFNSSVTGHHTKTINSHNSGRKILEKDYLKHDAFNEEAVGACAASTSSRTPNVSSTHLGECHICHKFIPWIDMNTHIPTCANVHDKCSRCGDHVSDSNLKDHILKYCPALQKNKLDSGDVFRKSAATSSDKTSISKKNLFAGTKMEECGFCEKKFPEGEFIDHIETCKRRTFICVLCLELVPEVERENHETVSCKALQDIDENSDSLDLPSYADIWSTEDPPKYSSLIRSEKQSLETYSLTCPTCRYQIPETKFEDHITYCSVNMSKCRFCNGSFPQHLIEAHLEECVLNLKNELKHDSEEGNLKNLTRKYEGINIRIKRDDTSKNLSLEMYVVTCPSCRHQIPQSKYDNHIADCSINMSKCRFCSRSFPQHLIEAHLEFCVHNSKNESEHNFKEDDLENPSLRFQASNVNSKNDYTSKIMNPPLDLCPDCGCHYNSNFDHSIDCQKKAACKFCNASILPKNFENHINVECKKFNRRNEWKTGKKKKKGGNKQDSFCAPAEQGGFKNYFRPLNPGPKKNAAQLTRGNVTETVMLPCEFCEKVFPMESLIEHQSGCRPDLVHYPPSHIKNAKEEANEEKNSKNLANKESHSANSMNLVPAKNSSVCTDFSSFKPIGSERAERLKRNEEMHAAPGEFLEYKYWKSEKQSESSKVKSNSHETRNFNAFVDDKLGEFAMFSEKLKINTENENSKSGKQENIQVNLNARIRSIWNTDRKDTDDTKENISQKPEVFANEMLPGPAIDAFSKYPSQSVTCDINENSVSSCNTDHKMASSSDENAHQVEKILRYLGKGNKNEFDLENKTKEKDEDKYGELVSPLLNVFKNDTCEVCGHGKPCTCFLNGISADENIDHMAKNSKGARPKQSLQNTDDSVFLHKDTTEKKFLRELSEDEEFPAQSHSYEGIIMRNSPMTLEMHQNRWNTWRERKSSDSD